MNIKKIIAVSALAVVTATGSYAATAVTTPNALLLGFRANADASVGANSFLFVGLDGFQNQSFQFDSQLTTQFGADWYTSGNIRWGIYGASLDTGVDDSGLDANGNPIYGVTTIGTAPNSGLGLADGNWDYLIPAGNSLDGIKNNLQANGLAETSSGYSYGTLSGADATSALNLFPTFQGVIGVRTAATSEYDLSEVRSLDMSHFLPNASFDGYGSYSIPGVVSVSSLGQITVVPEPSTYALLGLGALVALVAMRRAKRA